MTSTTAASTTPATTFHIALIGMSGAGKSHWSTQLTSLGFTSFCCDDLIEEKLDSELRQKDGTQLSMAQWMGHPFETQYVEAEKRYLEIEVEMMQNICTFLRADDCQQKNVVVDTTGSLIYTGEKLIECLRSQTIMVYLKTPPETCEKMYQTFLEDPKPVLWQGHFNREADETERQALTRCYPELLISRQKEYERYADVVIDFATQRQSGFDVNDFLNTIQSRIAEKS